MLRIQLPCQKTEMPKKQKSLLIRLSLVVSSLLFLFFISVIIAKWWIVPSIIKSRLISGISRIWDGPVIIDNIEFNYFAPHRLLRLSLLDKSGQERLHVPQAKLTIINWLSLSPVLSEIEVERLKLLVFCDEKFLLPPEFQTKILGSTSGSGPGLQRLTIKNVSIVGLDKGEAEFALTDLFLQVIREQKYYNIFLYKHSPTGLCPFSINGVLDPCTSQAELKIETKCKISKDDSTFLLQPLRIPPDFQAEGNLDANLIVSGSLRKLQNLQAKGSVTFSQATIFRKEPVILDNLNTRANLKGQSCEIDKFDGRFCGGRLTANLQADREEKAYKFTGAVYIEGLDLAELSNKFATSRKFTKGNGSGQYEFIYNAGNQKQLEGSGTIFINDADLQVLPVIPHLFAAIGLKEYDPLRASDAIASFSTIGLNVVIHKAQITNRWAAIKTETGAKINLQSGYIDGYVIAVPFKQIEGLFNRVPVVNLFVQLKDKLTRLRVRGHWSEPPARLITKEPIKDIKEGTVNFIKDVVSTGGQITEKTYDAFRKSLGFLNKKKNNQN